MVSTQELRTLTGSELSRRKFEIPVPCLCRSAHGRNASAGNQFVDSPASFAPSTPHKQAGSWLPGRSTSELRTEPTSSRHQADANTGSEVIQTMLRCKMERRWGRLGAPKHMVLARANPVGHPLWPPSQIRADVAAIIKIRESLWFGRFVYI